MFDDWAVNNVGVSHAHPVYFYETSEKEMNDIVQVNVLATLKITSLVLPNMVKMSFANVSDPVALRLK